MSQWTERIATHAALKRLITLGPLLEKLESVGPLTPDKTSALERLKQVRSYISTVLSAIDPVLLPPATLNALDSHLQNIQAECTNFQSSLDVAQLVNANGHADQALFQLANVPLFYGAKELDGLRSSITSLRRSVSQYHRYVDSEREGLRAPISQARQRLAELEAAITAEKARVDTVAADLQKQFSDAQEQRRKEFADEVKTRSEAFHERAGDMESGFDELIDRTDQKSAELLKAIEAQRDRAQQLLFVISNTGMVGGYQQVANAERKVARTWQFVAAGAFLGLIGFAILTFVGTLSAEFAWPRLAARVFVAVTFGILAAYAARQADRHEAVERQNRRTELALASLEPFLLGIPEDDHHDLKKQLALRFFGPEANLPEAPENRPIKGNIHDLLQLALQTAADLAKQK